MAINRAPFNALVDDDGSNSTGTPWNKAAIQSVLLDPIDAAGQQAPIDVAFNAADFFGVSPGLVWTVGAAALVHNRYILSGQLLFWEMYLSWFSGGNLLSGTAGPSIGLRIPGGRRAWQNQYLPVAYTIVTGQPVASGLFATTTGSDTLTLTCQVGNFTPGTAPGLISTFLFEVV